MEYWTFLVITLGGPFDGYVSALPYTSIAECNVAMDVVPQTMLAAPIDMVQCMESGVASRSIRPMPRPEGLVHG